MLAQNLLYLVGRCESSGNSFPYLEFDIVGFLNSIIDNFTRAELVTF